MDDPPCSVSFGLVEHFIPSSALVLLQPFLGPLLGNIPLDQKVLLSIELQGVRMTVALPRMFAEPIL